MIFPSLLLISPQRLAISSMLPVSKLSAKSTRGSRSMPASPGYLAAIPSALSGRASRGATAGASRARRSLETRSIQVDRKSLRSFSKASIASLVFPWRSRASASLNRSSPVVRANELILTASATVMVSGTFASTGGLGSVRMLKAAGDRSRKRRARMSACWFIASPPSRPANGSMSAMATSSGPLPSLRIFPWGEMIIEPPPRCDTTR